MANDDYPDVVMVTVALDRLEKLGTDEYIVAFGPNGRHFFATPNGYSASQLPWEVLTFITALPVKKITWASYGSSPESWFFAFEMTDGKSTFEVGAEIPTALRHFVDKIRAVPDLASALRVQLGSNDSFTAFANTSWACCDVPDALEARLCGLSSLHMKARLTQGSFRAPLSKVTWHRDGSYYLEAQLKCYGDFKSSLTRKAWIKLWPGVTTTPSPEELSELVFVALDPHAPSGDAFAYFKKKHDAKEAPFIIHFHGDKVHTSEVKTAAPDVQDTSEELKATSNPQDRREAPAASRTVQETGLQRTEQKPAGPKYFRWATCKRSGRPHPSDTWELNLEAGEMVKVWQDRGNNWFAVEGRRGTIGWAHGSRLMFCGSKMHKDPRGTYEQFEKDMRKLLVPGQLCEFPSFSEYMNACTKAACEPAKADSQLGICTHDLQTLLEGSGRYCYEWLKDERNVWHPDKFARYCHADHKEALKASAQEVFVMYGVLMDMCQRQGE